MTELLRKDHTRGMEGLVNQYLHAALPDEPASSRPVRAIRVVDAGRNGSSRRRGRPRAGCAADQTLAIRLQFEFAARLSEVLLLEWDWIDFVNKRVVWPDSKTGGMSKPLSAEAIRLLKEAPRYARSEYVIPALFDGSQAMTKNTYWARWKRILERAELPNCGTHAVRHRAATDIANSGVPVKVGMALTAHKTVTMFMRYVHTEDDPIRTAAEAVTARRQSVVIGVRKADPATEELASCPAFRRSPSVGAGQQCRVALFSPDRRRRQWETIAPIAVAATRNDPPRRKPPPQLPRSRRSVRIR